MIEDFIGFGAILLRFYGTAVSRQAIVLFFKNSK